VDFADGFGLIRGSNTTPVLVLRFEGHTPEALHRIEAQLMAHAAQRQARRAGAGGGALMNATGWRAAYSRWLLRCAWRHRLLLARCGGAARREPLYRESTGPSAWASSGGAGTGPGLWLHAVSLGETRPPRPGRALRRSVPGVRCC
jgi:hypothetical protein